MLLFRGFALSKILNVAKSSSECVALSALSIIGVGVLTTVMRGFGSVCFAVFNSFICSCNSTLTDALLVLMGFIELVTSLEGLDKETLEAGVSGVSFILCLGLSSTLGFFLFEFERGLVINQIINITTAIIKMNSM